LKVVTNIGSPEILVVGDFMLDRYVYGDALRISPEAPVPVLKVTKREYRCGGAASVAANLAKLGARPICVGVTGDDRNGEILRQKLNDLGADTSGLLVVSNRATISKERLIGLAQHRHCQQLIRIDEESTEPLADEEYKKLMRIYKAKLGRTDIVCLQDYNKAVLYSSLCRELIDLAKDMNKKVLIDPSLMSDYSKYVGACAITPNRKEASGAVGFEIASIHDAGRAAEMLIHRLQTEAVVITLDKEGAYLKTDTIDEHIPTISRNVYDVTGAGDMVLATLATVLAAGLDYKTAVQLSNISSGIEVEKFGAATVSIDEIINELMSLNRNRTGKICTMDSLIEKLSLHRNQARRIVFTNGCFDVLHRGHIEFLKFIRAQGDIVVLGLNSDSSVRTIKGPDRPINNQHDRAVVLAALETIDYIVIFDEPDPLETIKKVKPDILVKGQDWAEKGVIGREFVEAHGGKVVLAPLVNGKSTTSTIEKIKALAKDA